MLYNLLVDRNRFFDNSDNELRIETLVRILIDCYSYEIEELIEMNNTVYNNTIDRCKKKKIIIHRDSKKKIKANSLLKEIRWKLLDQVYNKELSINDNLVILNDSEIEISYYMLYRYCSNRGIVTNIEKEKRYCKFVELHQEDMSLRQELKYLEDNNLKISIRTLKKYIDRLEKNRDL